MRDDSGDFKFRTQNNFLIVADEIQAGCGRTGKFFSYVHVDADPDLVCLAKPLGGGLPLSAVIGNEKVADVLTYGNHGTTFGGNPVACAAGIAMIKAIEEDQLMKHAKEIGNYMHDELQKLAARHPQILDIRQYGLMIGVTVDKEAKYYVEKALRKHVIIKKSVAKSNRCRDKKTHKRSVSPPIRVIKSPVLRPPKYSNESLIKWS